MYQCNEIYLLLANDCLNVIITYLHILIKCLHILTNYYSNLIFYSRKICKIFEILMGLISEYFYDYLVHTNVKRINDQFSQQQYRHGDQYFTHTNPFN